MPTFSYKATDITGKIVKGEITVADKKEVINFLSPRNLIPVDVRLKKKEKAKILGSLFSFSKINVLDKSRFCERLSVLIEAGVGIKESLEILISDERKAVMKRFLLDLKADLEKGRPFYTTFETYKKDFSLSFVGLIKSGEVSGNLANILKELSADLKREKELRNRIKSASVYPSIVLGAATVIITGLLVFVMPRLMANFARAGIALPLPTRILLAISGFLQAYFIWILAIIVVFIIFIKIFKKTASGKLFFTKIMDHLPIIGSLIRKLVLARFCRTLSMVLSSGISLTESLNITADAAGNEIYKRIILNSQKAVQEGISLSSLFKEYPKYFPHLLTGTMAVSEQSGKLTEMLKPIADFYEEEIKASFAYFIAVFEPVLLLSLGLLIAFIALSILLPIYQMIGAI